MLAQRVRGGGEACSQTIIPYISEFWKLCAQQGLGTSKGRCVQWGSPTCILSEREHIQHTWQLFKQYKED